jgi:sarcosine oxidase, subunit beta
MNIRNGARFTPDVLIVGGGVIGSSIAYHAVRAGLSTLVLDRQGPASPHAASWASAGGVRSQGRHPAETPLAIAAIRRWASLADELDADLRYRRGGTLQVAESDEQAVEVKAHVERQHARGLSEVTLLARQDVLEIVPGVQPGVTAGSYAPNDGQADAVLTTQAFAAAARRLGAQYRTGAAVLELIADGDRVRGVRTATDTVRAGTVVLAASAGSTALAATVGLRLPVRPLALQMLRSTPAPRGTLRPVLGAAHRALSLKQLEDGAFLIGGGWPADIIDAGAGQARLLPERISGNWADACGVLPEVARYEITASWYGIEAESIDGIPFLGAVPGWPGLLVATGFSGHGFALAPTVGELIAAEVLGQAPPADVSGLRAARITDLDLGTVRRFVTGETLSTPSAG